MIKTLPTRRDFVRILSVSAVLAVPCLAQRPVDLAVQSADKFLSPLSEAQRAKVLYDFHNVPPRTDDEGCGGSGWQDRFPPAQLTQTDLKKLTKSMEKNQTFR